MPYTLCTLVCCTERSAEDQVLTIDESSVYQPPSQLQLPSDDVPVSNSDSAVSGPESDDNSSDNSDLLLSPGPRYADEDSPRKTDKPATNQHAQSERMKVTTGSLYLSITPKFYTEVLHQTLNPTAELWCKSSSRIKVDLVLHRT